jgi:hypothetical protein
MLDKSFQDYYPDAMAHCYGCGRLNKSGHQIKSYWDGEESVCRFQPKPYHIAIPGYVYGGLLASLIDCHGTGTAAAAAYRLLRARNPGVPVGVVGESIGSGPATHLARNNPALGGLILESPFTSLDAAAAGQP